MCASPCKHDSNKPMSSKSKRMRCHIPGCTKKVRQLFIYIDNLTLIKASHFDNEETATGTTDVSPIKLYCGLIAFYFKNKLITM